MSTSLRYALNIQRIDEDNAIRNQMDVETSLTLPDNIIGDDTLVLPNGAVNQVVNLLNPVIDFLFIQSTKQITLRLEAVDAPPLTIRAKGGFFIDGQNISAVYLSNASGASAAVRVVQALTQALV